MSTWLLTKLQNRSGTFPNTGACEAVRLAVPLGEDVTQKAGGFIDVLLWEFLLSTTHPMRRFRDDG